MGESGWVGEKNNREDKDNKRIAWDKHSRMLRMSTPLTAYYQLKLLQFGQLDSTDHAPSPTHVA